MLPPIGNIQIKNVVYKLLKHSFLTATVLIMPIGTPVVSKKGKVIVTLAFFCIAV